MGSFGDKLKESFKEAVKDATAKKITLDIAAGYKNIKGKEVTISKGNEPNTFKFVTPGLLGAKVEYEVVGVNWQESTSRSAGKAAAGAIIGGVLTGGLGLVAGAAIGGKKKDASTAVITIVDNNTTGCIYVKCSAKEYEELTRLL